MYTASMKTKQRLIERRLGGKKIKYASIEGYPFFSEECKLEIPTTHNIGFMMTGEMPITGFEDDLSVTHVLGCEISRVIAIEEFNKTRENTVNQNHEQRVRADGAAGELVEFLNHIKNPRVQVL
jgi:hypothetical protein|tara:strand:+ start:336 stop:707 length:372 start_codon:yes stop_codon:yes gene_type:complete